LALERTEVPGIYRHLPALAADAVDRFPDVPVLAVRIRSPWSMTPKPVIELVRSPGDVVVVVAIDRQRAGTIRSWIRVSRWAGGFARRRELSV
jgi:hypothetical protein